MTFRLCAFFAIVALAFWFATWKSPREIERECIQPIPGKATGPSFEDAVTSWGYSVEETVEQP